MLRGNKMDFRRLYPRNLPSMQQTLPERSGFNVHFSNGSKATYSRRLSGIQATNLHFERSGHIGFMVGDLDALEPVWKINGMPVDDWDSLD